MLSSNQQSAPTQQQYRQPSQLSGPSGQGLPNMMSTAMPATMASMNRMPQQRQAPIGMESELQEEAVVDQVAASAPVAASGAMIYVIVAALVVIAVVVIAVWLYVRDPKKKKKSSDDEEDGDKKKEGMEEKNADIGNADEWGHAINLINKSITDESSFVVETIMEKLAKIENKLQDKKGMAPAPAAAPSEAAPPSGGAPPDASDATPPDEKPTSTKTFKVVNKTK